MRLKDVKIGDVVRANGWGRGIVKSIDPGEYGEEIAVEFKSSNDIFHSCGGRCKDEHGYWLTAEELELVTRREDSTENVAVEGKKKNEKEVDRESSLDRQNHYKKAARQPIEFMQELMTPEAFDGFLLGNILKYRLRAGFKDDASKDIEKAAQYACWRELAKKGIMIDPERDVVPEGFTYEVV